MVISSSHRTLPDNTRHSQQTNRNAPQWHSNPQSQQASGHRHGQFVQGILLGNLLRKGKPCSNKSCLPSGSQSHYTELSPVTVPKTEGFLGGEMTGQVAIQSLGSARECRLYSYLYVVKFARPAILFTRHHKRAFLWQPLLL